MRNVFYCLPIILLLSACANDAMKTEDIKNMKSNCSNVDHQIGMLEKERKDNNKRLRAGITSIMPVTAAVNVIRGDYGDNAKIATGEWAKEIDAKLEELYALKAQCRNNG